MPMPNRHIQDANGYRYAYQGQEKDPETGKEAFELRLWDGRIGRWLTTDPAGQYHSPYLGMGNNPISMVDPDGGTADPPVKGVWDDGYVWSDSDGTWMFDGGTWVDIGTTGAGDIIAGQEQLAPVFVGDRASYNSMLRIEEIKSQTAFMNSRKAEVVEAFRPIMNGIVMLMTMGVGAEGYVPMNTGFNASTRALTVAAEAGENFVYVSVEAGTTQYVGITNNLARRAAEHLSKKGINIEPLFRNISRADARSVEQALIEIHKLSKHNGTLINRINSIAKTNPIYETSLQRGYDLLKSIGY